MHTSANSLYNNTNNSNSGSQEVFSGYIPAPASVARSKLGMTNATSSKIDYSKFKTKMCRNYLCGLPCPFEDRCAFSHGEDESERLAKIHQSTTCNVEESEELGSSNNSTLGETLLMSPTKAATLRSSGGLYSHEEGYGSTGNFISSNSSDSANAVAAAPTVVGVTNDMAMPPPPSYEIAVHSNLVAYSSQVVGDSYQTMEKDAALPPAYPTRYRHDPYSLAGIIYE